MQRVPQKIVEGIRNLIAPYGFTVVVLENGIPVIAPTPLFPVKPYEKSEGRPAFKQEIAAVQQKKIYPGDTWLPNPEIPMTMRLRLSLSNAGLTLEMAAKKTARELLRIRNFGECSLIELDDILESVGLPRHRPRKNHAAGK